MNTVRAIAVVYLFVLLVLPAAAQSTNGENEAAGAGQTGSEQTEQSTTTGQGAADAETAAEGAPGSVNEEELAINDPDTTTPQLQGNFTAFSWWDFLRMFLILGAVIAVIYGVFFLLKRMGNPSFQANNLITVLSTQNLQGNRSLHLVEVGNEVFLIGSSEGNVGLVSKIEDNETIDELRLYRSEMGAGARTFQETLRGLFNRGVQASGSASAESRTGENAGVQSGAVFLQKQRERLKKM